MDSLAGYIATLCVGAIGQYLSQFLRPKVKILYWLSHDFLYTIPSAALNAGQTVQAAIQVAADAPAAPHTFLVRCQTLTIQNFGRERAEWIEIVHRRRPDFFQLYPALNYTESFTPTGEHVLRVESLASKEWFTIQFLSHMQAPDLSYVRSVAGHASTMRWMPVRQYPRWVYVLMLFGMVIGAGFSAYWIIKGGIFVLKSVGAF